jgi:hypothetical protein
LQSWLAARYRRAAFPDRFNNILGQNKLDKTLAKLVEPSQHAIRAVYFDVVEEKDALYSLRIALLYDTGHAPEEVEASVQVVADKISAAFKKALFRNDAWHDIELVDCMPLSDDVLTYKEAEQLKQWRLEHLTLRDTRG